MRMTILLALSLMAGCLGIATPETVLANAIPLPEVEPPRIDGDLDDPTWQSAHSLKGEFVIADGSLASGTFPFEMWIGTTPEALVVAVQVDLGDWEKNPLEVDKRRFPVNFGLLLAGAKSELEVPSDALSTGTIMDYGSSLHDGYWDGEQWVMQLKASPGDYNGGYPTGSGRWAFGDFDPGVLVVEHHIPRASLLPDMDGFRLEPGGQFRMSLTFDVQGDEYSPDPWFGLHADVYPGDGYGPDAWKDSANWLAFRAPP